MGQVKAKGPELHTPGGKCMIAGEDINKVVCQNEEIRMLNTRNRKKKEETKEDGKGNKRILH